MKKFLYCFALLSAMSCTTDEELTNTIRINLNTDRVVDFMDPYVLSDFRFTLYDTKEDYVNEVNPLHTGSFDTTGKITITDNLIKFKKYYIDIYTDDKILSNWYPSDLDVDGSNIVISPDSRNEVYFDEIYILDDRRKVGDWEFLYYEFENSNLDEKTTPQRLTIRKDFTATSYETFENIDYTVDFDFSMEPMQLVSINPNQNSYPNPNGYQLSMYIDMFDINSDLLVFSNYIGDLAIYRRN